MQPLDIKTYSDRIEKYTDKELEEEYKNLKKLLNNIYQEYKDREDTIYLISRQMDKVRDLQVGRRQPELF